MQDNLTVRGIAKDLAISPYIYIDEHIQLNFSSEFNLKRFKDRLAEYKDNIEYRAYRLFGFNVNIIQEVILLSLYMKIEKRGFYVEIGENKYTNIDSIPL